MNKERLIRVHRYGDSISMLGGSLVRSSASGGQVRQGWDDVGHLGGKVHTETMVVSETSTDKSLLAYGFLLGG